MDWIWGWGKNPEQYLKFLAQELSFTETEKASRHQGLGVGGRKKAGGKEQTAIILVTWLIFSLKFPLDFQMGIKLRGNSGLEK